MTTGKEAEANKEGILSGGCLCGSVRYAIKGTPGPILNCHCSKCRRFHGHYVAYSGVKEDALTFLSKDGLQWFRSETDETPNVHRGFCQKCGTSLFWHPRDSDSIWVTLGSMDNPPQLKTLAHVWVSQKGDCYTIADEIPQFAEGLPSEFRYW